MGSEIRQSNSTDNTSSRADRVRPFYVMDILARAKAMEKQGRSVIHLEVGEPDFTTPQPVIDAGIHALNQSETFYTPASGLPVLREAISAHYKRRFDQDVDPSRIIVTPGASGALQLALTALLDVGEKVLLTDPGYPCYANIARMLGIEVGTVNVDGDSAYQLTADHIGRHWDAKTRAAIVSSPSNPTGSVLAHADMRDLLAAIADREGRLVVDEIYQGISYADDDYTALSLSQDVIVINSFSKYFGMTGWRLGWMVVPSYLSEAVDRLAQNVFLAPPTISQHAALQAFSPAAQQIIERRVELFKERRDYLLEALPQLGFNIRLQPQGAFYLYVDCSEITSDSFEWTQKLLETEGVALTPGIDFGAHRAATHLRIAYTRPVAELKQAVSRIRNYINN